MTLDDKMSESIARKNEILTVSQGLQTETKYMETINEEIEYKSIRAYTMFLSSIVNQLNKKNEIYFFEKFKFFTKFDNDEED